jgi:hypothetical protein
MKTKINHLLGAVPSLLVTFRLRLKQNATPFARLLILGLAVLVAAPSQAAKPGGGGGGGGTPEGTIYYIGPWDPTQAGTAIMTTMDPDGSNKTMLGGKMFGNPSTVLYNNHRWLIYTYVITGQYYPDGITKRSEIFALRDDFDPNLNNNANTVVQLTDDITLQPRVGSSTDWVPGGAQISFKARRWSSTDPGATVVEGGIYTASLVFGPDGNILGLAEQPTTPAIPFPLVVATPGDPWPELADYCWDPTGTEVVYAGYGNNDLWVASLLNVHTRIFIGGAYVPQWSPGGGKIVFSHGGLATINPDGSSFKLIIRNTRTWSFFHAHWSPDGNYIAYTGQESDGSTVNMDVFRATATGGSQVNLTGTAAPANELMHPAGGAGWR